MNIISSNSDFFLQSALAVVMLGLGCSLRLNDFLRVLVMPKSILLGLFCQLVVVPLVTFISVKMLALPPDIAVGIMIVAACPGGPTSNLVSHVSQGDVALSVTLTALSSIICLFSTPVVIGLALNSLESTTTLIEISPVAFIEKLIYVILFPVIIGMLVRKFYPTFANQTNTPVKTVSVAILILAVFAILIKEGNRVVNIFFNIGWSVLLIHIVNLLLGYTIATLASLPLKQRITLSIETGYQNNTFAIVIATTILHNEIMAVPAALYGFIKLFSGLWFMFYFGHKTYTA